MRRDTLELDCFQRYLEFLFSAIAGMMLLAPNISNSQTTLPVSGQNYPSKSIRLIVPSAPGGTPDIWGRMIAHELTRQMGQQVVVDNRPGAAGIIGTEMIARAAPDGYTFGYLLFPFYTNPSLFAKLPYDSLRDFQPVVLMNKGLNLLAVSPGLPIRSVKDLIENARSNPDKLSYGTIGGGSSNHLSMELFKLKTGTRLVAITYKAAQQVITDVAAGRIDVFCDGMPSILPHAKAGRIRAIAVTSLKRSWAVPELPTVDEAGVPGFEMAAANGYMLPSRAPRDSVLRLNAEINKALLNQVVQEKFAAAGNTPGGGTPEQFADYIGKEIEKWGKVIKVAGIKPQ